MVIPRAENAFIEPAKLSAYLLDLDHPVGGAKAKWFRMFGYSADDPHRLEADLLAVIRKSEEIIDRAMGDSIKYIVAGEIHTPLGRHVRVTTVWIQEPQSRGPRFVTAYPERKRRND